jgi:hypothetical protein
MLMEHFFSVMAGYFGGVADPVVRIAVLGVTMAMVLKYTNKSMEGYVKNSSNSLNNIRSNVGSLYKDQLKSQHFDLKIEQLYAKLESVETRGIQHTYHTESVHENIVEKLSHIKEELKYIRDVDSSLDTQTELQRLKFTLDSLEMKIDNIRIMSSQSVGGLK